MADGIGQARKGNDSLVFIVLTVAVAVCAGLVALAIVLATMVVPAPQPVILMPGDPLAAAPIPLTEIDDGSRIIFTAGASHSLENSIYSANINGTDIQRVTYNCPYTCRDRHPTVSPDGTRLAYHRYVVNGVNHHLAGIYTANADGSEPQFFVPNGMSPSWSPDGEQLAFFEPVNRFQSDSMTYLELFVINADGTNKRQLTESGYVMTHLSIIATHGSYSKRNISWSPDGRQIVFESGGDHRGGSFTLYIVNADGSGLRTLFNPSGDARAVNPSWSPDGERIVFEVGYTIYTIKPDGTDQTRLGSGSNPVWSPDGQHILFSARHDDPLSETYREYLFTKREINDVYESFYINHLFYMNADGSGVRRITRSTLSNLDGVTSFIGLAGEIDNETVFDPQSWDANGGDLFNINASQSNFDWYQPAE